MPIIDPNVLAMLPEAQGQTEPTDSQSIWDVLHPSIIQALQGMTQQRPPAESLFFPTTGEGGRPTFLGRHDKLRRGLEAGIMGLMNPPPPGSGGRQHLAQGLRSAFGYDAALQARADAPAQQRLEQLGPMMELARTASAGAASEAQAQHLRGLAGQMGKSKPIYDPKRGGIVDLDEETFTALEGITPLPPKTESRRASAEINADLQSGDEVRIARAKGELAVIEQMATYRATGAGFGGIASGRIVSAREKQWGSNQDKREAAYAREATAEGRAMRAIPFGKKWNIGFEESGEKLEYLDSIRPVIYTKFRAENDRGSWAEAWNLYQAEYMRGQRGPEPQAADGGMSVGEVRTIDGVQQRITKVYADGTFDAEPIR